MSSHKCVRAQKSVQSPVAVPANIIGRCVLPRATRTDCPAEDMQLGERLTHFQEPHGLCRATVNKLTDDSLLDIFDFCLNDDGPDGFENSDAWQTLVHVCRRWRDIVFASPRRLNLRLLCGTRAPRRVIMLDIWPALPIEIYDDRCSMGVCFVITDILLKHSDRVCSIRLREFPSIAWQDLAAAMQAPFPELTYLSLQSDEYGEPVLPLPDSFLGGSAPRLRTLKLLHGISFPALPNLLLSASDLVTLSISRLPYPKYVSPEAMLACLSSLTRLKSLVLSFGFITPSSLPGQPPQTRVVLPALTDLYFSGLHEHLEDFLSRIDTPVLNKFSMSFIFALRLVSDVPHLKQFIGRAKGLKPYKVARVAFKPRSIQLSLTEPLPLSLEMMCDMIGSKLHTMSLICGRP
ncbi:hypothetical protein BC826DRAFT_432133 [Russula brevipes]|nr:hypothetical protein BC826DRAFT_432133 [Russula brevipes]